eukprot:m.538199 g.538199  ORF g.538199 m.538199 type:complete len:323 (+) comp22080_c0_seq3:1193-2161(+)
MGASAEFLASLLSTVSQFHVCCTLQGCVQPPTVETVVTDVGTPAEISNFHRRRQIPHDVICNVCILIQPHVRRTELVLDDDRPGHRVHLSLPVASGAKYVTDAGTRDALERVATHPQTERNLHLLPAIQLHLRIVPTELEKERSVHREQPTRHHWRLHGLVPAADSRHSFLAQAPRKAKDIKATCVVAEVVWVDRINGRHDDVAAVLADAGEERLEPALVDFDVAVQERHRLGCCNARALLPRRHQPLPHGHATQKHLGTAPPRQQQVTAERETHCTTCEITCHWGMVGTEYMATLCTEKRKNHFLIAGALQHGDMPKAVRV